MKHNCFGCKHLIVGGEGTTHYWVCDLYDIPVNPNDGCDERKDKNA